MDLSALDWGRPLLVAVAAIGIWRLWTMRDQIVGSERGRLLLALAVLALAFWVLAAINSSTGLRLVTASRYQLVGAIFLLSDRRRAGGPARGSRPSRCGSCSPSP